jgi:light-regulated signal transduction histidine kinase (bacteriophytochrome)
MRDVLGFAQFLQYRAETGLNDKGRHLAQIISISREAERTDKLIEDPLKLARFYRSAFTETEVKLSQLVLEGPGANGSGSRRPAGRVVEWQIGPMLTVRPARGPTRPDAR